MAAFQDLSDAVVGRCTFDPPRLMAPIRCRPKVGLFITALLVSYPWACCRDELVGFAWSEQ